MKHYSAELENLNDVAAGANLEIKDGRVRSATIDTATKADAVDGFVISGGNFTHILDGQGSSFDPKTDTEVLNFIRTVGFSTATGREDLLLLDYSDSHSLAGTTADFTVDLAKYDSKVLAGVVSGTTLELYYTTSTAGAADVTITGLPSGGGGGGGGAATNDTNDITPSKTVHGAIDAFYDTIIRSEHPSTGVGSRQSVASVGTSDATGSTIAFTAASGLDVFANNDTIYASHPGTAGIDPFEIRGTVSGTPTATAVSIVFGAANATLTAAAFQANWVLTRNPISNGVTFLGASNNVVIQGNLQVDGSTTTINTATLDVEDKYITAANTSLGADKAEMDGGLFIEAQVSDTASTQVVKYAGIRYGAAGGTGFGWEVSVDATTDDGTTGTWQRLATGGEAVGKFVHSYSKAAAVQFITVAQTTHGLPVANTTDELYTVQVYEDGSGSWEQQIIPEQVIVATGVVNTNAIFTGSPALVAGDVLVQFGATTGTVAGRIIIKG